MFVNNFDIYLFVNQGINEHLILYSKGVSVADPFIAVIRATTFLEFSSQMIPLIHQKSLHHLDWCQNL